MRTLQPPGWPRPKGYANGIEAEGKLIFVAGQVAFDTRELVTTDDFAGQVAQALRNIVAILHSADAEPRHIVRMTWFVSDAEEYNASLKAIGANYREIIGDHYPAMSVLEISGFVEDGAKVEIEATAVVPH